MKVKFKKLSTDAIVPFFARPGDAAVDLFSVEKIRFWPGEWHPVSLGFAMELPPGFEAQIRPRSGLAAKQAVTVLNSPGTIDSGYRGEVKALLINHNNRPFDVEVGDKIAQMVIARVETPEFEVVEELGETERGAGGFGSTGK